MFVYGLVFVRDDRFGRKILDGFFIILDVVLEGILEVVFFVFRLEERNSLYEIYE